MKNTLKTLNYTQIKTILSSIYRGYPSAIDRCLSFLTISVTPINSNNNIMENLINIFEAGELPWYNE